MSWRATRRGLAHHFALTLLLNLKSGRALAYGYAVPLLFLLAFGGLFRADHPPLAHEIGQLMTITILGGACFGLPTALVAERERGLWRRLRLLPVNMGSLVLVTLLARLAIVASAVVLQFVVARLVYGTPWPLHPALLIVAFLAVAVSFLGLGLLIAALADDVPAVQALGQCLFLPMIMIGGVGVPLVALPLWAQRFAGFMPGRYAVDVLQRSYADTAGLAGTGFAFAALLVIGAAAGIAGARLFRWDNAVAPARGLRRRAALPLLAWVAVGIAALATGRLQPVTSASDYQRITDADLARIRFDDLPGDDELVTRLAPPFANGVPPARVAQIAASLETWPPAHSDDLVENVRHLVCVASIADIGADPQEAEIARMVFNQLDHRFRHPELRRALAWIILHPDDGSVVTFAPELDLQRAQPTADMVRQRVTLYAKKYLGRLTGRLQVP